MIERARNQQRRHGPDLVGRGRQARRAPRAAHASRGAAAAAADAGADFLVGQADRGAPAARRGWRFAGRRGRRATRRRRRIDLERLVAKPAELAHQHGGALDAGARAGPGFQRAGDALRVDLAVDFDRAGRWRRCRRPFQLTAARHPGVGAVEPAAGRRASGLGAAGRAGQRHWPDQSRAAQGRRWFEAGGHRARRTSAKAWGWAAAATGVHSGCDSAPAAGPRV